MTDLWDIGALSRPPRTFPAPGFGEPGVRALFYEGLPWRGRPTRVFAWVGMPAVAPGARVPGVVLVHGGGGTAFAAWVRHWTAQGFAALAMDTCGCVAGGTHGNRPRHPDGGPPGWGGFDQMDEPVADQWMVHAVADVVLGHCLLRRRPEVDPDRVGLTGVSWGAILCGHVLGLDRRFRAAAQVYGCGFLDEAWPAGREGMTDRELRAWLDRYDPRHSLPRAEAPTLWIVGTDDIAFPVTAVARSARLTRGPHTLSFPLHYRHGHEEGWSRGEVDAFLASHMAGGPPLPERREQGIADGRLWARFRSARPVARAELLWTGDAGVWKDRAWTAAPADWDAEAGVASAPLPEGATQAHLNVIDAGGLVVSGEPVEPAAGG